AVLEVEPGLAVDDADAHGSDELPHRMLRREPAVDDPGAGIVERDRGARDGGGAGPAVRIEHVAIDDDGALAEALQVDGGAEGAADEALDLLGPPADLAALARRTRVRGARQHGVLGRDPTLPAAAPPLGHAFLYGGGAEHPGAAGRDQTGALGAPRGAAHEVERPELVRLASTGSIRHRQRSCPRIRRSSSVLEYPVRSRTRATRPPAPSTSSRPTTWSSV